MMFSLALRQAQVLNALSSGSFVLSVLSDHNKDLSFYRIKSESSAMASEGSL